MTETASTGHSVAPTSISLRIAPDGTVRSGQHSTPQATTPSPAMTINVPPSYARVSSADLMPRSGGVLATALNKNGFPVAASEIDEDSTVEAEGQRMSVALAEQFGYIRRAPGGHYENAQAAQQAPAAEKAQPQDRGEALQDSEAEAAITHFAAGVPALEQIAAVEDLIRNDGVLSNDILSRASMRMGVDAGQVSAMAAKMVAGFRAQALAAVARTAGGVDAEAVLAWAKAEAREELDAAMRKQAYDRSTEGYRNLAARYVENLDQIDPEAVLNADYDSGITAFQADGEVILNIPKRGQVPYRIAVREGWIRVSKQ